MILDIDAKQNCYFKFFPVAPYMACIVLYMVMKLHDEFIIATNNIIYDDDEGDFPLLISVIFRCTQTEKSAFPEHNYLGVLVTDTPVVRALSPPRSTVSGRSTWKEAAESGRVVWGQRSHYLVTQRVSSERGQWQSCCYTGNTEGYFNIMAPCCIVVKDNVQGEYKCGAATL